MKKIFHCCLALFTVVLTGCGFHLQGEMKLAEPLHTMYINSPDPYGQLVRNLKDDLKMSNVVLVESPEQATTILTILSDSNAQDLLSVSSTQQTRQYNLRVTVVFEISKPNGQVIVPAQPLSEITPITIQSDQVLGSSNEASLFYQQMRRTLAYAIMNRIASKEITKSIDEAFSGSR